MNTPLDTILSTIDKEYITILREELDWAYDLIDNPIDHIRLEKRLSSINRLMITSLANTLTKNQLVKEDKVFDDTVKLFKLSNN